MPADFPPWQTVYAVLDHWQDSGATEAMHGELPRQGWIAVGRKPEPSAAVIDSRSVKAAETVARDSRGLDAGKKINGRKRHIAVDTIGLLLTVLITAALLHCSDGSARLRQGGGDGFGICAADDPLIPGGTLQAHPHAAGRVAVDCDEHLLAMAADSGHSGDAGDAHPDLEPGPGPGPAVGVVEHLDTANRLQRHTKVAVDCLGFLRTR